MPLRLQQQRQHQRHFFGILAYTTVRSLGSGFPKVLVILKHDLLPRAQKVTSPKGPQPLNSFSTKKIQTNQTNKLSINKSHPNSSHGLFWLSDCNLLPDWSIFSWKLQGRHHCTAFCALPPEPKGLGCPLIPLRLSLALVLLYLSANAESPNIRAPQLELACPLGLPYARKSSKFD